MPLRPFPYPLRVGTDLCKISRIRDLLARGVGQNDRDKELRNLDTFTKRFLTSRERTFFRREFVDYQKNPIDETLRVRWSQLLAGRWAAKEACIKAVKPRKITFSEVEIWPDRSGGTYGIILDEPAGEETRNAPFDISESLEAGDLDMSWEKETNGQIARVSISHDGDYACAVAFAVSDPGPNDTGGEAAAREPNGE